MIKRIIGAERRGERAQSGEPEWLSLEQVAEVEISSEDPWHPIEQAVVAGGKGWVAGGPGEQRVRLLFPQPREVKRVRVVVEEHERARTQEFVLRARTPGGLEREIARQQFTFSPGGATREQEDYRVDLPSVAAIELSIVPDISGGNVRATLRELRVG